MPAKAKLLSDGLYVRELENPIFGKVRLVGSVSPCVRMYRGYPLQVKVSLEAPGFTQCSNGGVTYLQNKNKIFGTYTRKNVWDLVNKVQVTKCKRPKCTKPAFAVLPDVENNREGECEDCFLTWLNKRIAVIEAKETARVAKLDAKEKARGATHKLEAWIHPHAGGDDYMTTYYLTAVPTDWEIKDMLKASSRMDDYRLVTL